MAHSSLLTQKRNSNYHLVKPIVRAFALGYLSSTVPRIIPFTRRLRDKNISWQQKLRELIRILTYALRLNGFPTACATLVGGSAILPVLWRNWCDRAPPSSRKLVSVNSDRLVRFTSSLLSSLIAFQLLNKKSPRLHDPHSGLSRQNASAADVQSEVIEAPQFAGRTLDLTLFTVVRAVDVISCLAWAHWCHRRKTQKRWTFIEAVLPELSDAGVFAASSAVVMWAWFYLPDRLPNSYAKWIGEVARVDMRLIEALRRAREGIFVYGKDTGQAPLLESMCKDYGWPVEWGDPVKTIPIPCEMVHMGCGPSCERHAVFRFATTFAFACATYIPLQIVFRLRGKKSLSTFTGAVKDAVRSSSFLAAFVSIFYYSVCLARTRVGPKILDSKIVTPMMWDSGLCVGAGCLMCGWSILAESARKRQEISLFVAPRAAATILPRVYEKKYLYRERAAFAIAAAILMTTLQERPSMVRGVFGKICSRILS
ncbi:hypothetical protein ASPZODRAFT_151679 [Penicilliopsis zonata CBS 506.65]|uniref:Integral membrane protein n=1 Tax=Penicilliopsis zonata CBS 506.65 TaxID=1073090 RepID=A0A1L9SIT8_9EURO|nr:hypothetical protein ASPZODRAFT_151679 [Penicilliopsis zonata CBS 506.65]OJJ47125.1 hypothetical protein ASPZODRAFT_151679 [Penicilliopsis zonata CBS 506.65]